MRSESASPKIVQAGATPVLGTITESDKIAQLAYESDIVINAADSDTVALTTAILRGLRKRYDEGKGVATFIHTSGAAIFSDGSKEGTYVEPARIPSVRILGFPLRVRVSKTLVF